ncbi:FecR family protein [soil metagenome]
MIKDPKKAPRPAREAADWFTRLNEPAIETEELEAFSAWRAKPENRAAYERLEDLGRAMSELRDDPDIRQAAAEARARGAERRQRRFSTRRGAPLMIGALAAACVIATIATATVLRLPTYSTRVGETFSATLEDGSRIQLNTDSAVKVRYSAGQRRVELLRGQAMFQVAHNAHRPFIVRSGDAQVRALGTRFDVRRDGQVLRVVLAQGSIEVTDRSVSPKPWRLTAGQALALESKAKATPAPVLIDVPAATSWTTGSVTFEGETLSEAVTELNRYRRDKIILAPGVPVERPIGGVFAVGDNDDFIAAVSALYRLKTVRRANGDLELQPQTGDFG